jgi:hypothetical protein
MNIIIENPSHNPDAIDYTQWSYRNPITNSEIIRRLQADGIHPNTHPKAVDLYAGDGSIARILSEQGWNPQDITCIDLYLPNDPLVPNAQWIHLNLDNLYHAQQLDQPLPPEAELLRDQFDAVFMSASYIGIDHSDKVCEFFVKPDGYILNLG